MILNLITVRAYARLKVTGKSLAGDVFVVVVAFMNVVIWDRGISL